MSRQYRVGILLIPFALVVALFLTYAGSSPSRALVQEPQGTPDVQKIMTEASNSAHARHGTLGLPTKIAGELTTLTKNLGWSGSFDNDLAIYSVRYVSDPASKSAPSLVRILIPVTNSDSDSAITPEVTVNKTSGMVVGAVFDPDLSGTSLILLTKNKDGTPQGLLAYRTDGSTLELKLIYREFDPEDYTAARKTGRDNLTRAAQLNPSAARDFLEGDAGVIMSSTEACFGIYTKQYCYSTKKDNDGAETAITDAIGKLQSIYKSQLNKSNKEKDASPTPDPDLLSQVIDAKQALAEVFGNKQREACQSDLKDHDFKPPEYALPKTCAATVIFAGRINADDQATKDVPIGIFKFTDNVSLIMRGDAKISAIYDKDGKGQDNKGKITEVQAGIYLVYMIDPNVKPGEFTLVRLVDVNGQTSNFMLAIKIQGFGKANNVTKPSTGIKGPYQSPVGYP